MTKRQLRKQAEQREKLAKQREKARAESRLRLYWIVNSHILDAITPWIWSIGKRKFNALLIGREEFNLLKEMKHAHKEGFLRDNGLKFVSYLCPKKDIQVIPVEAENYIKIANVVL